MLNTRNPAPEPNQPMVCHIRIKGHLDHHWADWFDGMVIIPEESGETLLTGQVVDQAALYGLLKKVRDAGMPLLSVVCTKSGHAKADVSDVKSTELPAPKQPGGDA